MWGVTANFRREGHLLGIGGGIIAGNLYNAFNDKQKDGGSYPKHGYYRTPIFPKFYLRWGREDIFFGEINIANDLPNSLISSPFRVGVGSGFGNKDKFKLHTGLTSVGELNYYINIELPVNDRFKINSTYVSMLSSNQFNESLNLNRTHQFGISAKYRFGL